MVVVARYSSEIYPNSMDCFVVLQTNQQKTKQKTNQPKIKIMKQVLQMHLRVLGIVFILLQSYHVFAQVKISGKVVDAEGKIPLAAATISTTGGPTSSVKQMSQAGLQLPYPAGRC